ncbi:hypothetical protein P43SY_005714 [Pythium insidiosum]|uniref:Phospholipid/glycerol acyltransferase domain-containing protein n=1 Tax=Pythium insidiosum TaxID=114742 RepID=A0AAD5LT93_PYTIN|nr:hypothetical protein P43SY_005714 [Pythium insidiosum]
MSADATPSETATPTLTPMMAKVTVEDVLEEVRFEERLAEIELRLPTTLALAKEGSMAKRNQARRQLYRDSEYLRIEIEERLNVHGIESEWLTSPVIAEANKKLDAVRAQLRLDAQPSSGSQLEKAYMFARFATFVLLFVGWFSAVFVLVPVRLLDATLKNMGVPRNYLPMDIISWGMARLICLAAGSDASAEGRENLLNLKDSVVCMFSHASNLDGFIVNGMSPVAFKYAGKKSLFLIPFLGWASRWGFGYVAIDRSNRQRGIKSLKELATSVNEHGNSVSISPEGTRSKDGLLQEFKKGPFYLRDDTGKNVVPAIIFGAYECWPPGRLFSAPGKTLVRFLPEFKPDASKNRNQNRLALRRIFLDAFAADVPEDIGAPADANGVLRNVFAIYLIWAITFKVVATTLSLISFFCFVVGISWWTFIKLSLLVSVGLEAVMFFTC